MLIEFFKWVFCNLASGVGKGGLERGWGRVGEGAGEGLGKGWLKRPV